MTTSPTKTKKPSLTEQLAIEQANSKKLAIELDEARKIIVEKQQEITNVFNTKNKEMSELLLALLRPFGRSPMQMTDGFGMRKEPTVMQLAGEVGSAIAQQIEKNNLQQSIIEEQDDQIAWFRELVEKVLGVKKPKVDTTLVTDTNLPPQNDKRKRG